MESGTTKKTSFPKFLPPYDQSVMTWIGEYLAKSRRNKGAADIARKAGISVEDVQAIEKGTIHHDLGHFRDILQRGYGRKLQDLLESCHHAFLSKYNPKGDRPFIRDYYYSICRFGDGRKPPTPFLVGGNPESFLWAVPIRKLKGQYLSADLLELAPKKVKAGIGETGQNSHEGYEVVHVINGSVVITINTKKLDGDLGRDLKATDSIHFDSKYEHQIRNTGNTPALLLIVRLPSIPKSRG